MNPSPSTLWRQAFDAHPTNPLARSARYIELMQEHGYIIDREPEVTEPGKAAH